MKEKLLARDRAGPDPQGRRQEHRRVRRVRRPRRHRRPAAHHRHELGPRQQPAARWSRSTRSSRSTSSHVDKDKEKIALGLKQKTRQPVGERRGASTRSAAGITGEVVNVMSYGAFVKLEAGHRGPGPHQRDELDQAHQPSRASWCTSATRSRCRSSNINKDKQEISLGMKQVQPNPWDKVAERYPPGTHGRGRGPQPHQLRRLHRDRGRHRRPAARQRHELGRARSAIPARWSRRARRSPAWS